MSQWGPPVQRESAPPVVAPSRAGGRARAVIVVVVVVTVLLLTSGALALAGVFDRGEDPSTATGTDPTGTTAADPPEQEIPGETVGTPDNPYAPGDSFSILDDWTFSVGATDTDAWPEVAPRWEGDADIDQYQPDPGTVYVKTDASAVFAGSPAEQHRVFGLTFTFVAPDGTLVTEKCGRYGTVFETLRNSADAVTTESGAVCVQALPEQAEGGQWQVSLFYYDEDQREQYIKVYYATR